MGEFRRVAGPQHGSIVVPSPVRNRVWTQYSQSDPGLTFAQPSAPVVDVCDYFLNWPCAVASSPSRAWAENDAVGRSAERVRALAASWGRRAKVRYRNAYD